MTYRLSPLGSWHSRTTFVLALSASAVGLGNLWRFSYLAGEHGGAPFVVTYLVFLFGIAAPLLIAETVIGSHGRNSPPDSLFYAADRSMRPRVWHLLGYLACITGFLILSYYVVIAGWAFAYASHMQAETFSSVSAQGVGEFFTAFLDDSLQMLQWHTLFLLMVLGVVLLGVARGLGALVWLTVPAIIALLGLLVLYSLENGDVPAAQAFLFGVQPLDFDARSVVVALGHAFFTLGVGAGVGMSYGAYAAPRVPLARSVMAVAVFDTVIALAAGIAIFPIVFANNIEPSMGPGLMFVSLPYAFGNMPDGELYGMLFFLLVVVAAWGSAVALLEPIVATVKQRFGIRRLTAVTAIGAGLWLMGVAIIFSFRPAAPDRYLQDWNFFLLLDALTADWLLPIVALFTAIFVGWCMRIPLLRAELYRESNLFFWLLVFLLRYIAPPAIGVLLIAALLNL